MYQRDEIDINTGEVISTGPLIITNELFYFGLYSILGIIFLIVYFKFKRNNLFIKSVLNKKIHLFILSFVLGIISLFFYISFCPSIFSPLIFMSHFKCDFIYKGDNKLIGNILLSYFYLINSTYPLIDWIKDSILIIYLFKKLKISLKDIKFIDLFPVILFFNIISYCIVPFYISLIDLWFEIPNIFTNERSSLFLSPIPTIIYFLGTIIGSCITTILVKNIYKSLIKDKTVYNK